MIAVTCRNGEHFSLDPDSIERVEERGDVAVFLQDGTHYVVGETFDELLRMVRDSRAAGVSARRRLVGPAGPAYRVPVRPRRADSLAPAVRGPAED